MNASASALALALHLLFATGTPSKPPARPAAQAADAILKFGRFGQVFVYGNAAKARQLVLFVSGDGGWELGVIDMARELAGLDALVVGIDIRHWLGAVDGGKESCAYPAGELEQLAQFVEKKLLFPRYLPPVLVGYSSGATLVYAAQAQAPPESFLGSISLGFCPDLWTVKPFCKGQGLEFRRNPREKGVLFAPAAHLERPWLVFQGELDQVCDPRATAEFVTQVPHGELVDLPKVGHGFSVPRNWLPQFKSAFARFSAGAGAGPAPATPATGSALAKPEAPVDLQPIEVPAAVPPADPRTKATLAVLLSGDGGWTSLDKEVAGELAKAGVPTVGWSSLQYYWTARTPEAAAADLGRILDYYLAAWKSDRVLLIGYSFGADVLPFLVARLPERLRARVDLVTLIAPSTTAQFEFHVSEWLGSTDRDTLPTAPEVERIRLLGLAVLCIQGKDENDGLCSKLPADLAEIAILGGGHHFGGEYAEIARRILGSWRR